MPHEYWPVVQSVLAALLTTVGATKIITARFEKKIQNKYDIQIAELNSRLKKEEFRHSQVFQTTEKTIAKNYRLLVELKNCAINAGNAWDKASWQAAINPYSDKRKEFFSFYHATKIYIPTETSKLIEDFSETLHDISFDWHQAFMHTANLDEDSRRRKNYFARFSNKDSEINQLLKTLESNFQILLGFPNKK